MQQVAFSIRAIILPRPLVVVDPTPSRSTTMALISQTKLVVPAGITLGGPPRNVKEEFTAPSPLGQCGYIAGFLRSRSYDLTLHIIGGLIESPDLICKYTGIQVPQSIDPFIKVRFMLLSLFYFNWSRSYPVIKIPRQVTRVGDDESLSKRTKMLKSTTAPTWREDLSIFGVEFDDSIKFELEIKLKEAKGTVTSQVTIMQKYTVKYLCDTILGG